MQTKSMIRLIHFMYFAYDRFGDNSIVIVIMKICVSNFILSRNSHFENESIGLHYKPSFYITSNKI